MDRQETKVFSFWIAKNATVNFLFKIWGALYNKINVIHPRKSLFDFYRKTLNVNYVLSQY